MIGKVLGNRYEVVEKIGGGGMALVYKAKCRLLNRYVAVKVLRPEFINDEEFINKFKRESQAAASLSHPNIVNIYDVGVEDNIYYIIMEYVDGKTLKQYIKEKGRLSVYETVNISIQIAEALNHAHKNHIVHRDIKPHNILISKDGRVKVADFGIARAATSSTVTNTTNVIGSVHYFSPEQARGGYTDEKSDIYSLGVVMYEMITGRVPFEGESPISVALKHIQEDIIKPSEIDSSIPKNIENIIIKCVEKDQSLRYDNAEELLDDLKKVQNGVDEDNIIFKDFNDSPTKVIPAIKDDMIVENKKGTINKRKSKRFITLIAILSAFLITSSLAFGVFLNREDLRAYIFGKEISVPNIVGLEENLAKDTIEDLGLEFIVKRRDYNSDIKEGHVISQSVDPDDVVKKGYPIEVVISKGKKLVEVPDLTNKYSYEIDMILEDAGLEEGKTTYVYSDVPADIVIDQRPEPNSTVKEGSSIDIVISKGPEINYLIMPKLTGLDIENAKKEILSKGFTIGEIKYEPSNDYEKDIVMLQNYPAGSEVEENTAINLVVSSGPKDEESNKNGDNRLDSDENKEDSNNQNNDENDNQAENAKELIIQLPQDKEKVEVKIYRIQNNDKELVYSKKHNTSEEVIRVTVSGTGKVKFEMYFDGVYKDYAEIDF